MMNRSRDLSRRGLGRAMAILVLLGVLVLPATSLAADGIAIKWAVEDDLNKGRPDTPDGKPTSSTFPVGRKLEPVKKSDYGWIPVFLLSGKGFVFPVFVPILLSIENVFSEIRQ